MLKVNKKAIYEITARECRTAERAVSTNDIFAAIKAEHRISKETLLRGLRELRAEGALRNYEVSNRNLWWTPDIDPHLPERIEVKIMTALKDIISKTGSPAPLIDIARASGLNENTVRYYLRYGRCDGVHEIKVANNKFLFSLSEDAHIVEKPKPEPIVKDELLKAMSNTGIGDRVTVDYHQPREGNKQVRHIKRELIVSRKTPRLCIFNSGDSVRWSDMVMYYRSGKKQAVEIALARRAN